MLPTVVAGVGDIRVAIPADSRRGDPGASVRSPRGGRAGRRIRNAAGRATAPVDIECDLAARDPRHQDFPGEIAQPALRSSSSRRGIHPTGDAGGGSHARDRLKDDLPVVRLGDAEFLLRLAPGVNDVRRRATVGGGRCQGGRPRDLGRPIGWRDGADGAGLRMSDRPECPVASIGRVLKLTD